MEAVILVGLQGAGKSTFCRERFYRTHLRLNLDMLRTRHRERRLLEACVATQTRFVVDNTNPTRAERLVYITAAKAAGYRVLGYYFPAAVDECRPRNDARPPAERVPVVGMLGTARRLEVPTLAEGFDELFAVRVDGAGGFVVEAWADGI